LNRAVATAIEARKGPKRGDFVQRCGDAPYANLECRAAGDSLRAQHGSRRCFAKRREVLTREAEKAPDFFPLYLGDNSLDQEELNWLHERRLAELELADTVIVPSDHIADALFEAHGTPRAKLRVIPYAADTRRF